VPAGVCRGLAQEHGHCAGPDRRARGTCACGPGHPFRLAGRPAGVHGRGAGPRTRPAAPQSQEGDVTFGTWGHAVRSFWPLKTRGGLTVSKKWQLLIFAFALLSLVGGYLI